MTPMRKHFALWLFIGVVSIGLIAGFMYYRTSMPSKRANAAPSTSEVVDNFLLMDHTGRPMELYRQVRAKAVVLISYGMGCPIVRKSLPAIESLRAKYQSENVRFFFIDANLQDTRARLNEEAKEFGIKIPLLSDATQDVSKSLGINRTGEVILIDPRTWQVAFRGPLDDRLGYGVDKLNATESYFENALKKFLNGQDIEQRRVASLGCAIGFESPGDVDYSVVAGIVREKCARCHSANGTAPTNLWTYQDLKGWGKMIKEVIRTEKMPPWQVEGDFGKLEGDFSMTAEEKRTIFAWIDAGYPPSDSPRAERSDKKPARKNFKADIELSMKSEITVDGDARTPWHYEPLISGAEKELWISGYDFDVANRRVMQHVALLVTKVPLDFSKNDFEPQNTQSDRHYSTWRWQARKNQPVLLREGLAYRIPKGSYVYLELHFAPTGKPERQYVRAFLRKYSAKREPTELKYWEISGNDLLPVPADTESFVIRKKAPITRDIYLSKLGAHLHMRGTSAKLFSIASTGERRRLFSLRHIFKNKSTFQFSEPVLIKAGTILEAEFEYDNSAANPARIDYSKPIPWGPDAFKNEMAKMNIYSYDAEEFNHRRQQWRATLSGNK